MTTKKSKQPNRANAGPKRAVIYIRVSSERQAKGTQKERAKDGEDAAKTSPKKQEQECQEHCERQKPKYMIVEVYRDIEKYRVGTRLVEPSATRADRPQLRRMLADARAGKFDVIIAWREDRLYRGYRPMLDVLDTIEEAGIDIELVKEHFDKNMAPVKAWAAKQELDAKHDRFMMGVAGRFEKGKDWNGGAPYGFKFDDNDTYIVTDDETRAVQIIWSMAGELATLPAIRRRLVMEGLPQRGKTKHTWATAQIYKILRHDFYWTGKLKRTWDGETYEIDVPIIIDAETARRVKDRLARFEKYRAGNLKAEVIAPGVVYCKCCNLAMQVLQRKRRKSVYIHYHCPSKQNRGESPAECARNIDARKLDAEIWSKVWAFVSNPERLQAEVEKRIAILQAQQVDAANETERISRNLDSLTMERQWVITQARKGLITENDMEMQLTALTFQESAARAELAKAQGLSNDRAERMRQIATEFTQKVEAGRWLVELEQTAPEQLTPEQKENLFLFKREVVREIVKRVDVDYDKTPTVEIEMRLDDAQPCQVCDSPTNWPISDLACVLTLTL